MSDAIPTKEDFVRENIDATKSADWELISASTIAREEFKYGVAKFETFLLINIIYLCPYVNTHPAF